MSVRSNRIPQRNSCNFRGIRNGKINESLEVIVGFGTYMVELVAKMPTRAPRSNAFPNVVSVKYFFALLYWKERWNYT